MPNIVRYLMGAGLLALTACFGTEEPEEALVDPNTVAIQELTTRVQNLEDRNQAVSAPTSGEDVAALTKRVDGLEKGMEYVCSGYNPPRPVTEVPTTLEIPVPTVFDQFVTDAVVRDAVHRAIGTQQAGGYGVDVSMGNWSAREAAFESWSDAKVGDNEPDWFESYGDATYMFWRGKALDFVRMQLRDQARLWAIYQKHKAVLVDEIGKADTKASVRAEIGKVMPVLKLTVPDAVRKASLAESVATSRRDAIAGDHPCADYVFRAWRVAGNDLTNAVDETPFKGKIPELQWRLRRESEGGQPLVDAWVRVLTDLYVALPKAYDPGSAP